MENVKVNFEVLRDWIKLHWKPVLNYTPLFSTLVKGWYIFHFISVKDRETISAGTWLIGRGSIVLTRWHPGFNLRFERERIRYLWVSLCGLPIQFWHIDILVDLANMIGKYIYLDNAMLRSHDKRRALLLVEVELDVGLPA